MYGQQNNKKKKEKKNKRIFTADHPCFSQFHANSFGAVNVINMGRVAQLV